MRAALRCLRRLALAALLVSGPVGALAQETVIVIDGLTLDPKCAWAIGTEGWEAECLLSGKVRLGDFAMPYRDVVRFDSQRCSLEFYGSREPAPIACNEVGQQGGAWVEVEEALGRGCRAKGTVWSDVKRSNEERRFVPRLTLVFVTIELHVEASPRDCPPGVIHETRVYWICRDYSEAGAFAFSPDHRLCQDGASLLMFESVYAKPEGSPDAGDWYSRVFLHVKPSWAQP